MLIPNLSFFISHTQSTERAISCNTPQAKSKTAQKGKFVFHTRTVLGFTIASKNLPAPYGTEPFSSAEKSPSHVRITIACRFAEIYRHEIPHPLNESRSFLRIDAILPRFSRSFFCGATGCRFVLLLHNVHSCHSLC